MENNFQECPYLDSANYSFVFIVTYGRSGSTLTQKILNSIPDYSIRGENGNSLFPVCRSISIIQNQYNFVMRRAELAKPPKARKPFIADILGTSSDPWYGAEIVDPDRYAKAMLNSFVAHALNPPSNARMLGFKDIHFHANQNFFAEQLDIMASYFPNCRFIFQTRNLEDVANSGWWKNQEKDKVIANLKNADQMFADYAETHQNCFSLHFDDVFSANDGLKPLFRFLSARYDQGVLSEILEQKLTHLKT